MGGRTRKKSALVTPGAAALFRNTLDAGRASAILLIDMRLSLIKSLNIPPRPLRHRSARRPARPRASARNAPPPSSRLLPEGGQQHAHPSWLHADRASRRDSDHSDPDRPLAARRAEGP